MSISKNRKKIKAKKAEKIKEQKEILAKIEAGQSNKKELDKIILGQTETETETEKTEPEPEPEKQEAKKRPKTLRTK